MSGPASKLESTVYRPWDREEKLGPPPWKSNDPKLIAWEQAHGHDVRLKCYPEFGCLVVQERTDRIEKAARDLLALWDTSMILAKPKPERDALLRLREALNE